MRVPFVDLQAQFEAIRNEAMSALESVISKTQFILGPDVDLFEKNYARYCQADYAVGVDSGTSALELALKACDVGPGDEVITAANTFIATAFAISSVGAKPVLVDVDQRNYNISVNAIEKAITPNTKAIIPVHLYGQPADMDPILNIARGKDLYVIEDACQAHGATYKGKRAGSLGDAAAFSFYPAKNLGAFGDGGMVVTNDSKISQKIKMLRDYGQTEKYHHVVKGNNHRLDTMQAVVLNTKLKYLDTWNQARRRNAELYSSLLSGSPVLTPHTEEYAEHIYHLYVIRVKERDRLQNFLREKGIASGIHYPIPIHLQPAFKELGYKAGDFPVTEKLSKEIISLPMFPELTTDAIEFVAETVKKFELKKEYSPDVL